MSNRPLLLEWPETPTVQGIPYWTVKSKCISQRCNENGIEWIWDSSVIRKKGNPTVCHSLPRHPFDFTEGDREEMNQSVVEHMANAM